MSFGRRRCCSLLTDPLRDMLWCPCGSTSRLVWCLAIGWCFAARNFRFPRGASDEHTLQRSVRSEQRSGRRKGLRPGGLRRKRPGASLLLAHRALRLCSLVAPCPRPFWAQRNTSQLRDTTLARAPVLLTQQMLDHHLIEVLIVAFRNQLLGFPFVECAGFCDQLQKSAAAVVE